MRPWLHAAALAPIAMFAATAFGAVSPQQVEAALGKLDRQIVAWRRDIHQHPELSNREFRTSKLVAAHLQKLGLEVRTGIAHTGVTAVLKGGRPGPVIALRADMDALPVVEQTDVPFKSTATSEYLGKKVGVMHACGHDAHVAILMGVAEALVALRKDLPGTVLFVFQPAEEGAPEGERGGASLMLEQGAFAQPKPAAAFGLHVVSQVPSGVIAYRSGPFMAASDAFTIQVAGRQSHGSRPWSGVDPIVAASQIVVGLQTIVSRQIDITELPAVVTVGRIEGGVRHNIIPDAVTLSGTMRTFDRKVRDDIIERLRRTAENIAAAGGAKATLTMKGSNPVVYNDPKLTERAVASLRRLVGAERVRVSPLQTGSEDFAYYAEQVPSFFFYVGVTPAGQGDVSAAPSNHSPLFYIDEPAIGVAARALMSVAVDYLQQGEGVTRVME